MCQIKKNKNKNRENLEKMKYINKYKSGAERASAMCCSLNYYLASDSFIRCGVDD